MKVLLINDHLTQNGGAERYFFDLKTRLKSQKEIDVISLGFGDKQSEENDTFILKAPISRVSALWWRLFFNPVIYFKLKKLLKRIQPDVIHLHNIKCYPLSILKAVKTYPVVQTAHDYSHLCPTAQNLHKDGTPCETGCQPSCIWQHHTKYPLMVFLMLAYSMFKIRSQTAKIVKKMVAPSPLLVKYLENNGFKHVSLITPFKPNEPTSHSDDIQRNQFFFAGNLGKHKGTDILIEEFAIARKQQPELTLYIAGTGPEETTLRQQVAQYQLQDCVVFLGWQPNLDHYYRTSSALIFPSTGLESFGLVLTEAMNHKRAIIGSNRGTTPWIVSDKHTGLLFDPLKRGDLAEKILTIARDSELTKKLGENGYKELQGLINNADVLLQLTSLYKSIC